MLMTSHFFYLQGLSLKNIKIWFLKTKLKNSKTEFEKIDY